MDSRTWTAMAMAVGVASGLAGCGGPPRDAVRDVSAFLQAAQGEDRMAFEAHIDRPAVRADLKGQLMAAPDVRALRDQLGASVGDVAIDRMLSPAPFRRMQAEAESLPAPGDLGAIRARLKLMGPGRACLQARHSPRCLLTFVRQERSWKLVGLHAPDIAAASPGPDA